MKKVLFLLFTLLIIPSLVLAQKDTPLEGEDLIGLTKPSIVKIVYSAKGNIVIPNFHLDYEKYVVMPPKDSGDVISISVDGTIYGTGFVVSEDGVIVTNSHIIESIVNDVYKSVIEKYLEDTTKAEIKQALIKHKTSDDAYDAAYDLIYDYLHENSHNILNKSIKVLKPYDNSKNFSVLVDNGYEAKILYSNPFYDKDNKDIAILKIEASNLPTIPLFDYLDSTVTTGQKVFAFGFPASGFLGDSDFLEPTFSQGFISAIKKQDKITIYQTDAKVSTGSSGSPLLDNKGNVIGIISLISGSDTEGDNFGFAISSSLIKEILSSSGIEIKPGIYFNQYKSGLYNMMENKCKKAIEDFEKSSGVNPDFTVKSFIDINIEKCNRLIESGKSDDSLFFSSADYIKNNYINVILFFVFVFVVIIFSFYFSRRIKKDEEIIEKMEETIDTIK